MAEWKQTFCIAPARLVDAGIRRDLLLDTLTASPRRTPVVAASTK